MKFLSSHTVPAGAIQREQIDRMAEAARNDPVIQPYRSFINLSEGKVVCVMDAPNEGALSAWFEKMGFPVDYIAPVELEGDRGSVGDA